MQQKPNINRLPISREQLLRRGSCCGKKCINCPYIPKGQRGATNVKT